LDGPNRAKFGTGMFLLNFTAGFANKVGGFGWFLMISQKKVSGFGSFHLLVCTIKHAGFVVFSHTLYYV